VAPTIMFSFYCLRARWFLCWLICSNGGLEWQPAETRTFGENGQMPALDGCWHLSDSNSGGCANSSCPFPARRWSPALVVWAVIAGHQARLRNRNMAHSALRGTYAGIAKSRIIIITMMMSCAGWHDGLNPIMGDQRPLHATGFCQRGGFGPALPWR